MFTNSYWVALSRSANLGRDFGTIPGYNYVKRAIEVAIAGRHSLILVGSQETARQSLALAAVGLYRCLHDPLFVAAFTGIPDTLSWPDEEEHRRYFYVPEVACLQTWALKALAVMVETGYPVTLVACAKPCPCGNYGDSYLRCSCSVGAIRRYHRRLSALSPIEVWCKVVSQPFQSDYQGETTEDVLQRLKEYPRPSEATEVSKEALELLRASGKQLSGFSASIALRVARTIAAMENSQVVEARHVAEAIQYRLAFQLPE